MRLPDPLMERDELAAATERSNTKALKKRARYEILVLDEWLTEDVNDVDISFPFELIDRRTRRIRRRSAPGTVTYNYLRTLIAEHV